MSLKLENVKGLGKKVDTLKEAGIDSVEKLANSDIEVLTELKGIGKATAEKIIDNAKDLLKSSKSDTVGVLDKEKLEKSYIAMLDELTKVDQLHIEYENMHLGVIPVSDKKEISKEEALTQIATQLNKLMEAAKSSKTIILLETTAGQGKGLGNKFHHFEFFLFL